MSRLSALLEALRSFGFRDNPDYALRPSLENPRVHRWTRLVPEERHGLARAPVPVPDNPQQPPLLPGLPEYRAARLVVPAGLSPGQGRWLGEAFKRDAAYTKELPSNPKFTEHLARAARELGESGAWRGGEKLARDIKKGRLNKELAQALEATARELIPHLRVGIWHRELAQDDYIPGTALTRDLKHKGYRPTYDSGFGVGEGERVSWYMRKRLEMDKALGWQHPSDNLKRPVYGIPVLVDAPGAPFPVTATLRGGRGYGDQLSVLKPEVVARTAFTQGDSLTIYAAYGEGEHWMREALGHSRMAALSATITQDTLMTGAMSPPNSAETSPEYTEAQVFGGVRMSRDREALFRRGEGIGYAGELYLPRRILHKLK